MFTAVAQHKAHHSRVDVTVLFTLGDNLHYFIYRNLTSVSSFDSPARTIVEGQADLQLAVAAIAFFVFNLPARALGYCCIGVAFYLFKYVFFRCGIWREGRPHAPDLCMFSQ